MSSPEASRPPDQQPFLYGLRGLISYFAPRPIDLQHLRMYDKRKELVILAESRRLDEFMVQAGVLRGDRDGFSQLCGLLTDLPEDINPVNNNNDTLNLRLRKLLAELAGEEQARVVARLAEGGNNQQGLTNKILKLARFQAHVLRRKESPMSPPQQ